MAAALESLGAGVELVVVRTTGDEGSGTESTPGDKSRFVGEIEEALLDGRADLAVHSAKDVPGELADGLALVGVPPRADSRDALCGARALADLPDGAVVGTASLRRRAQLLALRPDLQVRDLRGNVDTRLRRLSEDGYDAIVLACAGLERLGLTHEGAPLAAGEMVPAPGQGCLALEARADGGEERELAAELTDRDALVRLTAERAVVAALDATCRTPVGAHAELGPEGLRVTAFAGMPDGSHWIRDTAEGDAGEPAHLGTLVAERLIAAGAAELLAAAEATA